ncbi:MAG: response regulator [Deltaproteobacteria bacterium]|nr:response regulator [Deltaproteobacteria bacterium]MDQ3295154.1 ATP-binding protein [Myxococcota bacterium]
MSDDRLDAILEVLMSYARQDFSPRLAVSERRDEVDAIATGINLLAEELDGEVASRRELESAYDRLKTTQAQLGVAEKFAAIGQLANGVAHELNNPAAWVLLGVDAARRRLAHVRGLLGSDGPGAARVAAELAVIDDALTDAHAGMERMRAVINDLRTLSRADAEVPVELDLDEVVRSACQLARPAYLSVARLVLDLGSVPPIIGDRGRLGQLVTNLVINAAYAVADSSNEHEIAVTTRADGDDVVLAVEDSGPGIPEELLERVFEPYFTTKPSEVGTGLGLALVRKIAESHGGTARISRGTRRGARVEVRIPRARCETPAPPPASPQSVVRVGARKNRVLIVDDEPMLLRALASAIGDSHDVVTALGGQAGIELLAKDRAFDLVLCDLQMPGVDGVAIYESLASSAPALLPRFVVMSGGAVTSRAAQFLDKVRPCMLDKPIDIDQVLAVAADPRAHT